VPADGGVKDASATADAGTRSDASASPDASAVNDASATIDLAAATPDGTTIDLAGVARDLSTRGDALLPDTPEMRGCQCRAAGGRASSHGLATAALILLALALARRRYVRARSTQYETASDSINR
jgi:MYXO-CTERM domain-containing protein